MKLTKIIFKFLTSTILLIATPGLATTGDGLQANNGPGGSGASHAPAPGGADHQKPGWGQGGWGNYTNSKASMGKNNQANQNGKSRRASTTPNAKPKARPKAKSTSSSLGSGNGKGDKGSFSHGTVHQSRSAMPKGLGGVLFKKLRDKLAKKKAAKAAKPKTAQQKLDEITTQRVEKRALEAQIRGVDFQRNEIMKKPKRTRPKLKLARLSKQRAQLMKKWQGTVETINKIQSELSDHPVEGYVVEQMKDRGEMEKFESNESEFDGAEVLFAEEETLEKEQGEIQITERAPASVEKRTPRIKSKFRKTRVAR